jgi:hypothetical protein
MRSFKNKLSLVLAFLVLGPLSLLAQVPCSGSPDDPGYDPNNCPLDTYVWVLAGAVAVFAVWNLNKKQSAALIKH